MNAEKDTVIRLVDEVVYQQGTIVSRQVLKRDNGGLTLFAFDDGEGLTEHTSTFEAMILILDGEAEVTVSGRPHRLVSGEAIRMPAGEPHAVRALTRFKMALVMIRP